MEQPLFSVILPFYRQEDQVAPVLAEFRAGLDTLRAPYELIAVINGLASQAEERDIRRISESPAVIEVRLKNSGWGLAVKEGMAASHGTYVCYTNTARTKVDELVKLIRYAMVSNEAAVKATRVERSNKIRKWISIFYNIENRVLLGTPVWDVNATPKVIPRRLLDRIPPDSTDDLIDAELMYRCFLAGIPIVEVPVHHIERRGGKSTTGFRSAWRMFTGLIRVKNRYEKLKG